jgi:hypothetical protein
MFRTDECNNPTALTTDIAKQGGLALGKDYTRGPSFTAGTTMYYTAILIGDPVALTIKVIDAIGFYTTSGAQRWIYIAMPKFVWGALPTLSLVDGAASKRDVIGFMYQREGGTAMRDLFPNYGRV